jgi:hypothetical protein
LPAKLPLLLNDATSPLSSASSPPPDAKALDTLEVRERYARWREVVTAIKLRA